MNSVWDEETSWLAIVAEAKSGAEMQPSSLDLYSGVGVCEGKTHDDEGDGNHHDAAAYHMFNYESLFVKLDNYSDEDSDQQNYSEEEDNAPSEPLIESSRDWEEEQQPMQLLLMSAKQKRESATSIEDVECLITENKPSTSIMASYEHGQYNIAGGLVTRLARELLHFLADTVWEMSETYILSITSIHADDPEWNAKQLSKLFPEMKYASSGQPLSALTSMQRHLISTVIKDFSSISVGDRSNEEEEDDNGFVLVRSVPTLTPPTFKEGDACEYCHASFSLGTFRHHCRNCGASICNAHSSQRRRLAHYGGIYNQRVCDDCSILIDVATETQLLLWRKARLAGYFAGQLKPYYHVTEKGLDKALRLTKGAIKIVRNSLVSSLPAKVALEGVSLLHTYGVSGATGLLLRQDFLDAAETLRSLSGFDEAEMSLHEMTTSVLYMMSLSRGERGKAPEQEHEEHSPAHGCSPVSDEQLAEALHYAPLGCVAVYQVDEVECQRMAASAGWATICAELDSSPEMPAFALFAAPATLSTHPPESGNDDSHDDDYVNSNGRGGEEEDAKTAVLAIRGTKSLHDIVTDIRCEPVAFPIKVDEEADVEGQGGDTAACRARGWMRVSSSEGNTYACGGMARAAETICQKTLPMLMELHRKGFRIRVVGHSLGAAVAALLTVLIRSHHQDIFPSLKCFAYSCPNCMDRGTADSLSGVVVTIALRDDIVCRLRPASVRALVNDLTQFKEQALLYLQEDWSDVLLRLKQLWTPRRRQRHAHSSSSRSSTRLFVDKLEVGKKLAQKSGQADNDEEESLADLWLPGTVYHIYHHRGQQKIAAVPRDFPSLRTIQVQSTMLQDHFAKSTFNALVECRSVRCATLTPPAWTPYNHTNSCEACGNDFVWHSTLQGEPAQCRERHNCRQCGKLVCTPCTDIKRTCPKFGFLFPVRLCLSCQLNQG